MKRVLVASVLLLWPLARARSILDLDNSKQYPVTKVITLLKDMQAQLEKEADEDEEVYDKMACWCKTNDRDKTTSIKDAETRISDLTTTIESTAAASARLKVEIANHAADLAKNQQSLDQLTAIRTKQAAEFNGEEKDMLQSIKALGSAIIVLSKHHGGTSLFANRVLQEVEETVRNQMDRHKMMLLGVITPRQKRIMMGSFMQQAVSQQPQSGEIFGILRQMKETFESNLSDSQKEELANSKGYADQKAAKEDEIKAVANSLSQKKSQLAKSDETNAQSKEDLDDTQNSLSTDDQFLVDLKQRCATTDQEWDLRSKSRQEELSAIAQAISILSADDAHDTFSKVMNPAAAASFVQKSSLRISRHAGARAEAASLLRKVAAKVGSPELSGLAVVAELDAFTKVKAAIDRMVKELAEQKMTESKQRDYCTDKLNENTLLTERETREKSDSEMKMTTQDATIKELSESLETLHKEIADMHLQIKRASEDRELANKDFQTTISDQREMQSLLSKAINVLKAVYVKETPSKSAALAMESSTVEQQPPPPPGFSDYSKNSGGGGAVALLTQILGDTKVLEAEAVKDEQAATSTYESMVKNTNAAIATKQKAIVNKSQDKAKAEQDLGSAKSDLESQTTELLLLSNAKSDLNVQCDFLMKNFALRQDAFDEEIEALRQAKAILSGMQE